MFCVLRHFHWCNELYELDILPAFMEYGRQHLMDSVVMERLKKNIEVNNALRLGRQAKAEACANAIAQSLSRCLVETNDKRDHVQRSVLYRKFKDEQPALSSKKRCFTLMKKHLGTEADQEGLGFRPKKKFKINGRTVEKREVWLGYQQGRRMLPSLNARMVLVMYRKLLPSLWNIWWPDKRMSPPSMSLMSSLGQLLCRVR